MLRTLLFALCGLCSVPSAALAQEPVHHYARPGYATKTVYVWGSVGTPGVWKVEEDIGLIELLSAARLIGYGATQRGGPQELILRIYRESGGDRREIYREQVDQLLAGPQTYPTLQEGDVIAVESKQKIGWQTIASVVGAASSVALLFIRLTRVIN